MSAIPNVSAQLLERCAVDTGNPRVITLNGSDPSCDWQVDPAAAYPGLMPPTEQPSLITDTYVVTVMTPTGCQSGKQAGRFLADHW